MSRPSFIKRILAFGKAEEAGGEEGLSVELESAALATDVADVEVTASGEAAAKPSITEILFQRRGMEPDTAGPRPAVVESRSLEENRDERRMSRKEETAQKMSEGLENMSSLLKSINQKLESGNERGMVLADSIEQLPEVLKSIPETSRAQIEFLGTISKQLDLQTTRTGELLESLSGMPDALRSLPVAQERQAKQLQAIAETLTENNHAQRSHLEGIQRTQQATLGAFQTAQNKSLNVFHKAQQQSLNMFKGSQESQAKQIQAFVEGTQRSMNRVLIACAAIVGIAILGVAAMLLFR